MAEHEGICAICFEPVKEGQGKEIIKGGRKFHRSCTQAQPNSYYLKLEEFKARYQEGKEDINKLMTDMEKAFNIPLLNDDTYNQENEEVIKLYREMSNKRDL